MHFVKRVAYDRSGVLYEFTGGSCIRVELCGVRM